MIVNFRVRGISRGIYKLARTFKIIKKKLKKKTSYFNLKERKSIVDPFIYN
jgi:hypothetical protein